MVVVSAQGQLVVLLRRNVAQVHVLSKGQSGFIGVGYQTEEVLLSRLPGWDPHSYGERAGSPCRRVGDVDAQPSPASHHTLSAGGDSSSQQLPRGAGTPWSMVVLGCMRVTWQETCSANQRCGTLQWDSVGPGTIATGRHASTEGGGIACAANRRLALRGVVPPEHARDERMLVSKGRRCARQTRRPRRCVRAAR